MLQYETCFLTKFPDRCGAIRAEKPLVIGLRVRQKSALSRKGERAEGEGAPLPPYRGNDLCMSAVYCALAGSAGWWTLKIYIAGGLTETLNSNCLGCCVRLGGATNLRVAVPLLSLRVR